MGIFVLMRVIYIGNKLSKTGGINPTSIETLGVQLKDIGCEMRYSSSVKNQFLRWLDMAFTIFRFRKWAQIVLIDTYSSKAFFFAWLVARLCHFFQIPYFPILRGGNLKERILNSPKLCDQVFKNSAMNIGVSNFLKSTFEEKGYAFQMIPNNIPVGEYEFQHRFQPQPKILWVRSMNRVYNPLMALDILKLVKKEFPHATLAMVGPDKDGSLGEFNAYAKSLGLEDSAWTTGGKSKLEWRTYSKDFSIFLSTTNIDNTPISVMEAMALGLPVVSTNVGGVPFIIESGENGLLYPPQNPQAGAEAILSLLKNPELSSKLSENGRKTVESWDWEVVKYQWKRLFETAIKNPVS
jgi:glycosyltransferase involved in cell wall biosynthesis